MHHLDFQQGFVQTKLSFDTQAIFYGKNITAHILQFHPLQLVAETLDFPPAHCNHTCYRPQYRG